MRMRRSVVMVLAVALGAGHIGCAPRRPVEVALPTGVDVERVIVQLLDACAPGATILASSVVTRGSAAMELGAVDRDVVGVRVLALDASCAVVAEGCVEVVPSESGLVHVDTTAITPRACTAVEACTCSSVDAGTLDAVALDAPDCVDCDGVGQCEQLRTDRAHCGRCNNPCTAGDRCLEGVCGR